MYVSKRLIKAIAAKDYAAIESHRVNYSYNEWSKLLALATKAANAVSYKPLDFSPQVSSATADKPSVASEDRGYHWTDELFCNED